MNERCSRSQAGFTLVEALVALCLVASVATIA
ncbi:MAG: prepilin-type N-terminal cleavage/methylation domain-containing protein [Alphaproteobacteria bacterium]